MKTHLLIAAIFIFSLTAHSAPEQSISIEFSGTTLKAGLKEGFHFNEKAPNSITLDSKTFKPFSLQGRTSEFKGLPAEWSKGYASLYVCDDAVTFCQPHTIDLKSGKSETAKIASTVVSKSKGRVNAHGFIEDDLQKALEQAKAKKHLVLIDFSARWCPGCIRLEKEVFDTQEFKKATSKLVKVKIDVDRFENQILGEKFNVKAIPTLLVLNDQQQEVDRLVDYQPKEIWKPFFAAIEADPAAIAQLMEKEKTPEILNRLGHRLATAGRFQESLVYLNQVQPPPADLNYAKVEAAKVDFSKDPAKKDQLIKTLKAAIASEPESSRSISWRSELVGHLTDKEEIKKVKQEGVVLADSLLSDEKKLKAAVATDLVGEFTGYESLFVAGNRADLVESSGADAAETKAAWERAADAGRALKIPASKSGPALRYLITLTAAKLYDEADKTAQAILKLDPNNADVQRRRVKVLVELKRFPEAISLGEKSLKNSYGRNEFWIAESLAKAYIGANKNDKAIALLDRYLAKNESEWANLKSTRKSMDELRQKIAVTGDAR